MWSFRPKGQQLALELSAKSSALSCCIEIKILAILETGVMQMNFNWWKKLKRKKDQKRDWQNIGDGYKTPIWKVSLVKRKEQITGWMTRWTKSKGSKDALFMLGVAVLVVAVGFIWFNVGLQLAGFNHKSDNNAIQEEQSAGLNQDEDKSEAAFGAEDGEEAGEAVIVEESPAQEKPVNAPVKEEAKEAVNTKESISWNLPVKGKILCEFGEWYEHPVFKDWRYQTGIDWEVEIGEPIVAAASGTVETVDSDPNLGTVITISHSDKLKSRYLFCSDVRVVVGQKVKKGDELAITKQIDEGVHFFHLEITEDDEYVNPNKYLTNLYE